MSDKNKTYQKRGNNCTLSDRNKIFQKRGNNCTLNCQTETKHFRNFTIIVHLSVRLKQNISETLQ